MAAALDGMKPFRPKLPVASPQAVSDNPATVAELSLRSIGRFP
jgi:hypothetical protein